MGGGGGGGKGGGGMPMQQPTTIIQQAPIPDYAAQDAAKEAKNKAAKALLAMKGRASTILTGDNLGTASISKQRLLSGAA